MCTQLPAKRGNSLFLSETMNDLECHYDISPHTLGIEARSHAKPLKPPEQQLCLHCRNGCFDGERYFLTQCEVHVDIGQRFTLNISTCIEG